MKAAGRAIDCRNPSRSQVLGRLTRPNAEGYALPMLRLERLEFGDDLGRASYGLGHR